ncbi:DUF6973 domain-containing protein [Actinokineospora sp. HUAS TT18]|uniref:DUF6973 domain-containing protein n=1 Tax=Actinokineospora sp. HUAS TT18 TaxID=3447451 RepID=UPI003F51C138
MATYGQVRDWASGPLENSVSALNGAATALIGLSDELGSAKPPESWDGPAAEGAHITHADLCDRMEHLVAEVAAVRAAVADAADSVTALANAVADNEGLAAVHFFLINDDGDVMDMGVPIGNSPDRERIREQLVGQVAAIVDHAKVIDDELTSVLSRAAAAEISDGGARTLADAAAAGDDQGSFHDRLMSRYKVTLDPRGMTTYPSGPEGWLAEQLGFTPREMTVGEAEQLDKLSPQDRVVANDLSQTALDDSRTVFNGAGMEDGHSDAYRHAYWNAMMANDFGAEWTEDYATAHERGPGGTDTSHAMDLHNNEVGRRIAEEHPGASREELSAYVEQAVRDGEMVVIGPDGNLVRSNEVPIE